MCQQTQEKRLCENTKADITHGQMSIKAADEKIVEANKNLQTALAAKKSD